LPFVGRLAECLIETPFSNAGWNPWSDLLICGSMASKRAQIPAHRTSLKAALVAFGLMAAGTSCEGRLAIDGSEQIQTNPDTTPDETAKAEASIHRLNRLEYNNSVRELLGTGLRPADTFPPDASVGGFDNVADALSISPALMDRYVGAAATVVEDAFASRPVFEDRFEENDPRLTYTVDRDANRIGGIVRLRGGSASGEFEVTTAGPHSLVVGSQGLVNGTAAAPRMRFSVAGQDFDFDVPRTAGDTSFAIELAAGRHPISVQALNFEENAAENRGNDIMFDYAVIRSDASVEGPARQIVMTCDPAASPDCASTIVQDFARRAWRRPLTPDEIGTLDQLLVTFQNSGENAEESIKLALRAVLTSAKFVYRYRSVEDKNTDTLLDPWVLASRLSFFIWSSTPNDRLLQAADDGTLATTDGIRQTVTWMLADPRATALADGFAEQWLDLRHLGVAAPSAETYPGFNESVRDSMVLESKLFFLDYVENKAPLASMLEPDFAYRDATLAAHLGLTQPIGDGFERVTAVPGERRGILSLSAWLTARSDSTHASPIKRGSWIADNILCAPVPPPPAGLEIGLLMEAEGELSLRQSLELHRGNPTCASCHTHLDVLGMGFEVFDGVGRNIEDPALDSQGELPLGQAFRGADEMAAAMDRNEFVSCVSTKLLAYALGRALTDEDRETFANLPDATLRTLTLPDLITAIVLSPAFSEPTPLK
jgi:hypothetical protein